LILTSHITIDAIDAAEWEVLAHNGPLYLTHRWLKMVESSEKRGKNPKYFIARRNDGRLIGAVPCYFFDSPPSWLYDPAKVFSESDDLRLTDWFPAVIAGGCSEFRGDLLLDADVDPYEREVIVQALVSAAHGWAVDMSASLLFLYMPTATARMLCRVPCLANCALLFQDAEHVLRVPGHLFDDYVQQLSRSRRSLVRREMRAYMESGGHTEAIPLKEAPIEVLAQLHTNLMRKYGHQHEVEDSMSSLASQRRYVGDWGRVFLAGYGQAIAGFSLCYQHAGSIYVRLCGYDYNASIPFTYSQVMIYDPLAEAIAQGLHDLQLGLSTNKSKLLRGADAVPLYAVLCPRTPLSPNELRSVAQHSDQRLQHFWSQYGEYVLHQNLSDMKIGIDADARLIT
jgi:predicted N-acyltransferase